MADGVEEADLSGKTKGMQAKNGMSHWTLLLTQIHRRVRLSTGTNLQS